MDTNTTGRQGQALPEDEGPVFISEEDILEVFDVNEGACVCARKEPSGRRLWIDRFDESSPPSHPTRTHADAPPLESDDDEDAEDAAAAGGAAVEDEEGDGDDGVGGGGGGGGVRFVAEYEDGTIEELHAPPPDMAVEVCVYVCVECNTRGTWCMCAV